MSAQGFSGGMRGALLAALLLAACGSETQDAADAAPDAGPATAAAFADVVVDAPGDTGEGFTDAELAVNGVRGAGELASGTDVFSLGFEPDVDAHIVLRWSGRTVLNGPGADFAVFENPFEHSGGLFIDPAIVYLSRDGASWVPFPHEYLADDPSEYDADPALWDGFAGLTPVLLHEEDNPVDPQDPELAGGDHFDLDDLPTDDAEAAAISADGFSFLKIVSAPAEDNPDTGEPYVAEAISNGADIDGVYAWYFAEE